VHAGTTKNFNNPQEEDSFGQLAAKTLQNSTIISATDAQKGNLSLMQIVLAGKNKADMFQTRSGDLKQSGKTEVRSKSLDPVNRESSE